MEIIGKNSEGPAVEDVQRRLVKLGYDLGECGVDGLFQGDTATYLGDSSVDSRGVAWYRISWEGGSGWVSSRYTTLY